MRSPHHTTSPHIVAHYTVEARHAGAGSSPAHTLMMNMREKGMVIIRRSTEMMNRTPEQTVGRAPVETSWSSAPIRRTDFGGPANKTWAQRAGNTRKKRVTQQLHLAFPLISRTQARGSHRWLAPAKDQLQLSQQPLYPSA